MPRQKRATVRTAVSEASSASADTDDDKLYHPDSDTDLTEPEYPSPGSQKSKRRKIQKNAELQPLDIASQGCPAPNSTKGMNMSAVELHHARYEDPADDTDEDLSKVPGDYGRSEKTKKQRLRLKDRWARYCQTKAIEPSAELKWCNAGEALRQATSNDMYRFLNWCLKLQYNPDGRLLKGYTKASALEADWKFLRTYYTQVTGHTMSKMMGDEVRTGIRYLIDKYSLDTQPRENVPVYIEDMVPFNETILRTREKRFHLGFQRILLCLYITLGLFTINRKNAILHLQFKHLQISLQKDPQGGPPIPMIELQPRFVKSYLGMSKINTFALPEIVYGVSLVLSPHVLLFIILFYVGAFEAPHLNSMEDLRRLLIKDDRQEMLLPLKKEMDDYYIFPKVHVVKGKPRILWKAPMNEATLDAQLRSISEIHGLLNYFFSHQFRYGGGALLDKSGFVSEAQRSVIMNHASSRTFVQHYCPRQHAGMQEIMCDLKPNLELLRAVSRMSRWIDQRRPRDLTDADRASVEKNPELQSALRWQFKLESQYNSSNNPTLREILEDQKWKVDNLRRSLQEKQRKEVRRDFSRKQAVIDIEKQLAEGAAVNDIEKQLAEGAAVNDEVAHQVLRKDFAMPPQQIGLVKTFFTWPTTDSLEDEWTRRNKAIAAGVEYCGFAEGGPLKGRRLKCSTPSNDENQNTTPPARKRKLDEQSTVILWEKESAALQEDIIHNPRPVVCFQCHKKYSDHNGLKRHFMTSHLQDDRCNFCDDLKFHHEMHLQRHAADVHRLRTKVCNEPLNHKFF
ncbi:C2H2 finger domain protein [Aspergillus ellipticus CBS 707.79]|uniref:C2H2 finger domain protein n=1 Tax=Aspergillus ellipticus CBS 707.79 TaxID=1448320 RepID=A0A319DCK2_9EURO|nr:C2H2 finger domain protein [Aspergillus ellipticus CBS 707.79]